MSTTPTTDREALRALIRAVEALTQLSDTAAADVDVREAMAAAVAVIVEEPKPAAVWLVYCEFNENEEPEIVGIYSTHQKALDAQAAEQAQRACAGEDVFAYPTTDDNNDLWDVDVHVDEYEIDALPSHLK